MIWILIAFQIAVIAYVYAAILTRPEMILGDVFGFLTQVAVDFPRTEKFLKPVMLCVHCVAGQMALWTLILYGWFGLFWVGTVIHVLFFLSVTILIVEILQKLLHGRN